MGAFRTFLKGENLRFKLLLYFFTLILLPTVTLGVLGNVIYSKSIEDQATVHTGQMIEQVTRNVEFYIHDMENIIYYLSDDPQIIAFMKHQNDENDSEDMIQESRRVLKTYSDVHQEVAGILVVNDNNFYISNGMDRISRDPLTEESWYKRAFASPKVIHLFSKPIGRNIKATLNYSGDEVVSIAKAVMDPLTGRRLGVILIDLKLEKIKQVIEAITLGKNGFLYIMDANGGIVYAPINPIVYRVKNEWLTDYNNSIVKTIQGSEFQIIYKDSTYTNWKTIGVFSLNETLQEVTNLRHYSIMIGIITLVLAVIAAFFFTASIAKPLSKLRMLMKRAEEGDLSVRFNSRYNDEIGQLGNSFNNMIKEISNLIDMVYVEQRRKREAELKTLQAQIKPHFLYNTLYTIQWMAQEHGAQDVVKILGALANLFRIGLSKGKEMIQVHEELEHVGSYLAIQKARYEDKLTYEIHYDEEIIHYRVLKLILQPLVENAIYHGINARRGGGKIIITGSVKEEKLYFSVVDNGIGITKEKLKEIRELLDNNHVEPAAAGFGIFNVNERIRLSFGKEYGLIYTSVYEEGTKVELWHPLI
ncbi:sensor histidine kinase [Pelosinus sp. UFO1]|uniref:sensor histidine kinase n=1 Tax=Pelosinus sp. UFO1 TaxID=484770 RepID=UPI0004D1522B|nr:sensor histidine kinase [Pelosinus sp. UFO1]AIF52679.1 multi-sensor signal transduction histidine kinase [Pelosinus sp. UFO1]